MVTNPPLPLRGPECPPAEALEAFSAGDALDQASNAHIAACRDCSAYVGALERGREEFLRQRPLERFARNIERREVERRRRRWLWLTGLIPAAVAAGWLTFMPPATEVRLKGGEFVTVCLRQGAEQPEPVTEGEVLRAGDRLRFLFRAATDGFVVILDRDGTGRVTTFFPQGQPDAAAVGATPALAPLAGSIVLDDAPGPEWLVAVFSPSPVRVDRFAQALRDAPSPDAFRPDCPGCRLSTLRIEKGR